MKFVVNIREVHILGVEVEANSEDEARQKAQDNYYGLQTNMDFQRLKYSHTLPKEQWYVCNIS